MTPELLESIRARIRAYSEAKNAYEEHDARVAIEGQALGDIEELLEDRDNLAHELKCSNETIDMLYEKSRRYVEQVDKYEAEAKRLRDIVEVYDDRFATLNDEKNKEISRLKSAIEGGGALLTGIGMIVGKYEGLAESVKKLKAASDEFDKFALAIGYAERPEGQSGVHRMSGPQLVEVWKAREKALDEAHDELRHIHGEYTLANTSELTRDGMAMAVAALKQQVDVLQKGRLDAEIARANAERRYDNLRSKVLTTIAVLTVTASAPEDK